MRGLFLSNIFNRSLRRGLLNIIIIISNRSLLRGLLAGIIINSFCRIESLLIVLFSLSPSLSFTNWLPEGVI